MELLLLNSIDIYTYIRLYYMFDSKKKNKKQFSTVQYSTVQYNYNTVQYTEEVICDTHDLNISVVWVIYI